MYNNCIFEIQTNLFGNKIYDISSIVQMLNSRIIGVVNKIINFISFTTEIGIITVYGLIETNFHIGS